MLTPLEQREIFHLAFLRGFVRRVKPGTYALKGGTNLRFFFGSIRYSEDMDIDITGIEVFRLKELVMDLITAASFANFLGTYGIRQIIPPNVKTAKQTETVQRFKVHLISENGDDLFTKIEFSRRGLDKNYKAESVSDAILRNYHLPPLIVEHYTVESAVAQKLNALAGRNVPQARDVFDLFILSPQVADLQAKRLKNSFSVERRRAARDVVFSIAFENFRDSVCQYLPAGDFDRFARREIWEEMRMKVASLFDAEE